MRNLLALAAVLAGCTGSVSDSGDDDGMPPTVAFVSPSAGEMFARTTLGTTGALVADVPIQLEIGGTPARVTLTRGDTTLGDASAAGDFSAELAADGPATLTATAFDADGNALATASVDVAVTAPEAATCHDWLDLYHIEYTLGPDNPGIADPVTAQAPINGVAWRYTENTTQRKTMYADCELIKSLAAAAPILRAHDVTEVADIGIYNYRCIDQSKTPPNCTMSQHAYAKAIDIAALLDANGTSYSVLTDWDIDPATTTCSATTTDDKDAFLHTVICELKAADVWNIVLTPNYNSDHRNHFHVDLTEGADTIKRLPTGMLVLDDEALEGELVAR